ncbi:MAG: hypothetical protein GC193_09430 [Cryomorphaceae bacterium]|nr:hypothetical protein [Cryomorphaceae bacterium]
MSDKEYQSISHLSNQLHNQILHLEDGELELEDLQFALENAREIYERLVVLRYRAYDELVHTTREMPMSAETVVPELPIEEPLVEVAEEPELATEVESKVETPIEQESLFEEIPEVAPAPIPFSPAQPSPSKKPVEHESIGEKLSKSPIADLKKAIGLNQKFLFINTLFAGDAIAYDEAVSEINKMPSFSEAEVKCSELRVKYKWSDEEPATEQFEDLVERRFL